MALPMVSFHFELRILFGTRTHDNSFQKTSSLMAGSQNYRDCSGMHCWRKDGSRQTIRVTALRTKLQALWLNQTDGCSPRMDLALTSALMKAGVTYAIQERLRFRGLT